jgi:hypothetical protein
VIAAGNRGDDSAFVRPMSSALLNRLFVVHVVPMVADWLAWAEGTRVRADIRAYVRANPESLLRKPDAGDGPFSSPRAWAALSRALDLVEASGSLDGNLRRVLAHGRISPEDADRYCEFVASSERVAPGELYIDYPDRIPPAGISRWHALQAIRDAIGRGAWKGSPARAYRLLTSLDAEERSLLLSGLVREWLGMVGPTVLRDVLTTWVMELSVYDHAEAS